MIIYSVANETPVSESRNHFLQQLMQAARSSDPTRLVSAALQPTRSMEGDKITMQINDPVGEAVDVLGANEYIGWYTGQLNDTDVTDWSSKSASRSS
jgi:beta-glucuronidase